MAERETGTAKLRRAVRTASPKGLRIAVASARRALRDIGTRPRLARRSSDRLTAFDHCLVEVVQDVKGTAFVDGKLANLRLGADRLDGVVVAPGETFSFWKLVGRPSQAAGFEQGRTIRGGVVAGEVGGGLCQLSGIAYEAGLRAGLKPVERYPHSADLYIEEDRFTPLGLDATVVWPYKDLRLANDLPVPVKFRFSVDARTLTASVHVQARLEVAGLELSRIDEGDRRYVRVMRRTAEGAAELISEDVYRAS